MRAGKRRRLSQTQKEADGHDGLRALDGGRDHGQRAKADHHAGEEVARREIVDGQVGGDLAENVAGKCQQWSDMYRHVPTRR